jgi:hypothetical protein
MAISKNLLQELVEAFIQTAEPYIRMGLKDPLHSYGKCDGAASDLFDFLYRHTDGSGLIDKLELIECIGFKKIFGMPCLHIMSERQKIWHCVVRVDDWYVDLTGAQFGQWYEGLRILTFEQLSKEWDTVQTWMCGYPEIRKYREDLEQAKQHVDAAWMLVPE